MLRHREVCACSCPNGSGCAVHILAPHGRAQGAARDVRKTHLGVLHGRREVLAAVAAASKDSSGPQAEGGTRYEIKVLGTGVQVQAARETVRAAVTSGLDATVEKVTEPPTLM